jgi:hypothetical protein
LKLSEQEHKRFFRQRKANKRLRSPVRTCRPALKSTAGTAAKASCAGDAAAQRTKGNPEIHSAKE